MPFSKATDTRFPERYKLVFCEVEEDAQDLYPVPATNKQDFFIWHKSSIGWGNHTDLRVIPQWDNYEDCWTINMQSKKDVPSSCKEGNGIILRFRTSTNSTIAVV
ncbi:MAG: hypothetical protein U5K75_08550 [Ahrensia sp.]|nr:hypothetical protein [Ahrensia sp.]